MSESIDKELYERLNEVQAFGRFPVYPQVLDGINNFEQVRFALELARQSNDCMYSFAHPHLYLLISLKSNVIVL